MKEKKPLSKPMLIAVTLSISLLLTGVSSPSLVMAYVYDTFPNISTKLIPFLLTLPLIIEIPSSIIGGIVATKMKKRNYLAIACALFIIGGIGPRFVNNFYVMLGMRAILGVGVGMALPMATGLIPLFFPDEKEQAKVFGYQATFVNIGGMIMSMVGGIVAATYWKNIFFVYLTDAIVAIIVLWKLPEPVIRPAAAQTGAPAEKAKFKITPVVCLVFAAALIKGIIAYVLFTHMSLLIINEGIGDTITAGTAQTCIMLGGMLIGLVFGVIFNKIKSHMIWVCTALMAICYFALGAATSAIVLFVACFFHGVSSNIQNSTLSKYASSVVDREFIPIMTGTSMSLNFGGQFLSSLVLGGLAGLVGMTATRDYFTLGGIVCAVISAISLVAVLYVRAKSRGKAAVE